MAEQFSEQIRQCGMFFVSLVVLGIFPLVYHCFVFLTCVPMFGTNTAGAILLLIFFHFLFGMVLISYYQVIFTDPGYVPYTYDETWRSEMNLASRFGLEAEVSEKRDDESMPLAGDASAAAAERKRDGRQRKCAKCHKVKPDRAHHCKYCGRCVLKMDHHCPWVNNCIGFTNYKFFMLFCIYCTTAAFYVTVTLFSGFVAVLVEKEPIEFGVEEFEYILTFILMATTWIVLTGFTGFHLMLVSKNLSTIEHLEKRRSEHKDAVNPFDMGRAANWRQVFGDNPLLWFIPVGKVQGNGADWPRSGRGEEYGP